MSKIKGDTISERAILCGICQFGNEAFVEVEDLIDVECFTYNLNQIIYKCLSVAVEKSNKIDIPLVLSVASDLGLSSYFDKNPGSEYLQALFEFPIKLDNIRGFSGKIKKLQIIRKLQVTHQLIHEELGQLTGSESVDHILSVSESPLFDMGVELSKGGQDRPVKILEDAKEYLDHLAENPCDQLGFATSFPRYDRAIGGGLRPGSVNLITARPKAGKSNICKQIGFNLSKNKIPVLMLDTEMNKEDQIHRLIASGTDVDTEFIETGRFSKMMQKVKIYKFVKDNKELPLYYMKVAGKPFDEILSIIRRWHKIEVGTDKAGSPNNCVVLYDYFKLMDSTSLEGIAEYQAMGFQISKLTDFCGMNRVACLAFVQANRNAINSQDTDIISQSDRLLWLCGSAAFLKRKSQEEQDEDGDEGGNSKLIVLESRYGPGLRDNDYINLAFETHISKFTELSTNIELRKKLKEGDSGFAIQDIKNEKQG